MKTILAACAEKPCARIAWMKHPAEDETPEHFHLVASFVNPVRLSDALERLYRLDPHNYVKPCRNFRASVRYLAHLDNPEKVQLDPADIALAGDWEGVNLPNLFERHGATADLSKVLGALREYLETHDAFRRVDFALWLDSHGYSATKAFNMVRVMGLDWRELVGALLDDPGAVEEEEGATSPALGAVPAALGATAKKGRRPERSKRTDGGGASEGVEPIRFAPVHLSGK